MASRPFQFLEKKRSKIRKRAAKHFEGLAALSTHSTGRRAAVKTGCKPVHFSLDGCPLSCYFPGVWPLLRDTLSTSRSVGRGTGAFIYLPPFSETSPIFCSFPFTKSQPVFLPEQTGRKKHRTPFPPSATPAGITHYTLLRKVVCQMGALPPFGNPHKKRRYATPHGAHTAFSCYPALRLYRLSKSQRGIGVVSLSKRTPIFPLRNCLICDSQLLAQLFLCPVMFFAALCNEYANFLCVYHSMLSLVRLSCTFVTLIMS